MHFYIGICDDESVQQDFLISCLQRYFKTNDCTCTIKKFSSGEELLENYPNKLDILFLDIQMDKICGMETAIKIREFDNNVEIIFNTAFCDYMSKGYEVRAYRYLVKPFKYDVIQKCLNACISHLIDKNENYIIISNKTGIVKVCIKDILYIETDRHNLIVHEENSSYTIKTFSIKNMDDLLKRKKFFRCHTSYIINLNMVNSFSKNIIMIKNHKIPVSKYRIKKLKEELLDCLEVLVC